MRPTGPSNPRLKPSETITDGESHYYCDCVTNGGSFSGAEARRFTVKHRKAAFNPEQSDMFTSHKDSVFLRRKLHNCCREGFSWPPELLMLL